MGNELSAVILQYVLSGVLGFACALGSAIFEIEHWSIARQTVAHFLLISGSMLPISYVCRWIGPDARSIAVYFGIFGGIYLVIWFILLQYWKRKIRQVNKRL
jgi:hypothetical protein